MGRTAIILGAAMAIGCAGSRPPPPQPPAPALCVETRRSTSGQEDFRDWSALLLRRIDPTTQRPTTPALDCTGAQVRWDGPGLVCEDGSLARAALPERAIGAADVIVSPVSPDLKLVWIVTSRFASGDALGPVALVETTPRQLRVLAVGPLRAYPQNARLRLEVLGDRKMLVAEGEFCASAEAASCARAARVVPLRGDRFVPQPLLDEARRCVSPAWFDLARRDPRPVGRGWERMDLSAAHLRGCLAERG